MQVSEHRSELGRWRVVQRSADPRLRAYVHGYLGSEGYVPAALRERHLPSPEVAMVVNFGSPHRTLDVKDPKQSTRHDNAWVVGLHESYQLSEAVGAREFMAVRFTPIGAHAFLRVPMDLIANHAIELEQLDPKIARQLWTRLDAATDWGSRFAVVESLIAESVMCAWPRTAVIWAWDKLQHSGGQLEVGLLASEMGWSHRHLIAQFRKHVGLTPKTIGRMLRFNRAVRVVNRLGRDLSNDPVSKPYLEARQTENGYPPDVRWAEVAVDCGYFDQSHFIKEFQEFAGMTPIEFLHQADVG